MKHINKYINEKLKISKGKHTEYIYHPKTKKQLIKLMTKEIKENGFECSLNHIDVSRMTNFQWLFNDNKTLENFDGDISDWDVSNVEDMSYMFAECNITFKNTDLSGWNVSKCKSMAWMFEDIQFDPNSEYNYDLSGWDMSNVDCINGMFYDSNFNSDSICQWNVSNITKMYKTFARCKFNQDLSGWNASNVRDYGLIFAGSGLENKENYWPKEIRLNLQ
jgi:uncharacterized protein YjbI with pentapeptide repeats